MFTVKRESKGDYEVEEDIWGPKTIMLESMKLNRNS